MDKSLETRVAVLEVRAEKSEDQDKRIISHVESEQRNTQSNSKRIDALERQDDRIIDQIGKHEKILINSGNGLNVKVDRLENQVKEILKSVDNSKDKIRWNVSTVINLIIAIVSIVSMIITIITGRNG